MKREKDNTGRMRVVFEPGDGIRRRYRILLNPELSRFPRNVKLKHSVDYFLGELPNERPLFAVYKLATLAEYFLWHTTFGGHARGRGTRECHEFFAATRKGMQNILSTYRIDRPIYASGTRKLRALVRKLQDYGRAARAAMKKSEEPS